jgi:hypothetical protein
MLTRMAAYISGNPSVFDREETDRESREEKAEETRETRER